MKKFEYIRYKNITKEKSEEYQKVLEEYEDETLLLMYIAFEEFGHKEQSDAENSLSWVRRKLSKRYENPETKNMAIFHDEELDMVIHTVHLTELIWDLHDVEYSEHYNGKLPEEYQDKKYFHTEPHDWFCACCQKDHKVNGHYIVITEQGKKRHKELKKKYPKPYQDYIDILQKDLKEGEKREREELRKRRGY